MESILQTPRLWLREMTEADFPDLCEILQDEETMYAYEHAFSDAEAWDWLHRQQARYRQDGFGLWAMIRHEDGAFIGQAGLTMQDWEGRRVPEIGYLLKRRHWHCGYATEAACGCRDHAFGTLGLDAVYSIIRDTNAASRRVALRVGMHQVGRFVKHYYGMDMPHDVFCVTNGTADFPAQDTAPANSKA